MAGKWARESGVRAACVRWMVGRGVSETGGKRVTRVAPELERSAVVTRAAETWTPLAERGGRERGVLLALAVAGGAVGRGHAGRGRSGSRGRWTGRVGRAAVCGACARAVRLVSGPGLQGGRRGRVLRAGVRVGAGQARTRAACGVLGRSVGRAGEGEGVGPWGREGVAGPAGLGRGAGMDRGWAQVAGWAAGFGVLG